MRPGSGREGGESESLMRNSGSGRQAITELYEAALRQPQIPPGKPAPLPPQIGIALEGSHDRHTPLQAQQGTEQAEVGIVNVREIVMASDEIVRRAQQEIHERTGMLPAHRGDRYVMHVLAAQARLGRLSLDVDEVFVGL